LLIGNLLQSQEVTPSSHHSIMRWLLESAELNSEKIVGYVSLDGTSLACLGYLMSCLESRAVKFIRAASPGTIVSVIVRRSRTCSGLRSQP
jgi:hypothetical protein